MKFVTIFAAAALLLAAVASAQETQASLPAEVIAAMGAALGDAPSSEDTSQFSNVNSNDQLATDPEYEFSLSDGENIDLAAHFFEPPNDRPFYDGPAVPPTMSIGEDSVRIRGNNCSANDKGANLADPNLSPALVGGFSTRGLKAIVDRVLPAVIRKIRGINIPGQSGKDHGFKWSVDGIHLDGLSVQAFDADVKRGLFVGLRNIQVQIGAHFKYKKSGFPWIPFGSGRLHITVVGSHMNALFDVRSNKGKITLAVKDTSINLSSVRIRVSGSWFSWLYNIVLRMFQGTIRRLLNEQLTRAYRNAVNAAAAALSKNIPTSGKVGDFGLVDLGLTAGATYFPKEKEIMLPFNGEVYPVRTKKSDGAVPRHGFTYKPTGHMLDLYMSDYVMNTAYHAYALHGGKHFTLTHANAPKFPISLESTAAWALFAPGMAMKWPAAKVEIDVSDVSRTHLKEPRITARAGSLQHDSEVLLEVFAVEKPAESDAAPVRHLAFRIVLSTMGVMRLKVENRVIKPATWTTPFFVPQVPHVEIHANVTDSRVGEVFIIKEALEAATFIVNAFVLPEVNKKLLAGFPLPSVPGLSLLKTVFTINSGHVVFGSDIGFKLPPHIIRALEGMHMGPNGAVTITLQDPLAGAADA